MTEQELRALVREAVARHLGSAAVSSPASALAHSSSIAQHASHALFVLPAGEGPCLIEPAVPCNHCGFCKSYGH